MKINIRDLYKNWKTSIDDDNLEMILYPIIKNDNLHHRFLYTLSYLENCGAKKIKAMEPAKGSTLLILKHAAEEARHAYFFRRQILKLNKDPDEDIELLGKRGSRNYLNNLDIKISKCCRDILGLNKNELKMASYLLTTFCVEIRAEWLFDIYQELLNKKGININLSSIIKEEENHLDEMILELEKNEKFLNILSLCLEIEEDLFFNFYNALKKDLKCKSLPAKSKELPSEMKKPAIVS